MTNLQALFESLRLSGRFKLPKYQANLTIIKTADGIFVRSYETYVAELIFEKFPAIKKDNKFYSTTTSKHINYVADFFNLTFI